MNKEIIFITTFSQKIGFGHLNRCFNFQKIIKNRFKKTYIYTVGHEKYKNVKKLKKINNLKNKIIIMDLPKNYLKKYEFLKLKNKLLLVDNFIKHNNCYSIIPTIIPYIKKKNTYSGKNWIILDPKINKIRSKKIKQINRALILFGGSLTPTKKIIFYFKKFFRKNYLIILGPLVNKNKIDFFKKNKIRFIQNPKNIFYLVKSSKYVFTRYGITMYEALSLKKKPIVFINGENKARKKEIIFLMKKKIIDTFHNDKIDFDNSFKNNLEIKLNKKVLLNLITKITNYDKVYRRDFK